MKLRLVVATLGSTAAVLAGTLAPSVLSPASAAVSSTSYDVRVGSFNISSVSYDGKASGDMATWRARRPVVVSQIIGNRLDVLGLQEANQSNKYAAGLDYGVNQYMDLKGALAARGGHYALTNDNAYNCVKPSSQYNCVVKDRQASQDNRIMYNTDRVAVVRRGAVRFATQTAGKNERYLVWGVFKMKATGKQFLFTDTHLDPYSLATRRAQWDQSIAITNRLKGARPVVAVGDYNTSKWDADAATYLPRMKRNGYGDVVNQEYAKATVTRRAEAYSLAWVNSFQGFHRDLRNYAYEDAQNKIGNGIDYVFASNNVRVKQWAVVANLDPRTLRLRGVIPSDHHLVRAIIVIK
jgi:endonuclease/exonuclease/phosphatase family metal-dependent hydrolase